MNDKVLSDGKRINGKGRLTDKICNKIQTILVWLFAKILLQHGIMTG